ncbi:MAG TPA: hypothetical protein VNN55_03055 [bacterium]|nr:hypothetical protein [bacterium]
MIGYVKSWIARRRKRPFAVDPPDPRRSDQFPVVPQIPEDDEGRLYALAVIAVRKAEATRSSGSDKRDYAIAAISAGFRARGWPMPKLSDICLAIEVAVRELRGPA